MNLYLISQRDNNDYDTFSAAVVCAPDKKPLGKCTLLVEKKLLIGRRLMMCGVARQN